jgi:NAD(P)-dependent dehydrogenase (short-subunit alcohol dehydrogenase family)
MSEIVASQLLRAGLLDGVSLLLAGAETPEGMGGPFAAAVAAACTELGARVSSYAAGGEAHPDGAGADIDEEVRRTLAEGGSVQLLVIDAAGIFAAAVADGPTEEDRAGLALRSCLDVTWNVTRTVVNDAFLARGEGGRIVYLAPRDDAGLHAGAARAGLENLARTLSVEWARHSITVVTIAPGEATTPGEVAALTAYLASPAGAYFSGCLLDLGC